MANAIEARVAACAGVSCDGSVPDSQCLGDRHLDPLNV